jgi:hypothetical protein
VRSFGSIQQQVDPEPGSVTLPQVDVLLCAGTWDRRSISVTEIGLPDEIPYVVLLRYADRGTSGRVDQYESVLYRYMASVSLNAPVVVDVDSRDLVAAWLAVRGAIVGIYESLGRPLKVGIDLNSVPRYVVLSLLGYGFRTGLISDLSALYSAAKSYESISGRTSFTEGSWRPRAVPTLGEGVTSSARSLVVISAGFEGEHTRRLVNALEPDQVIIALSEGIDEEHDRASRKASVRVAEEYLVGDSGIVFLPAFDVKSSLTTLHDVLMERIQASSIPTAVSFVLCGTKISAFAMGIYALDGPVAQVYYSDPERRLEATADEIAWHSIVSVHL